MSIYSQQDGTAGPGMFPHMPPLVADLLAGGGELRVAQVELANLVAQAIDLEVPLVSEAGTGTGKTKGYLIPLIRSGKVGIISTSNKNLQQQIWSKDIPFLQQHVQDFSAALVKGVGNYVCLKRVTDLSHDSRALDLYANFGRLCDVISDDSTFTGDFESLTFPLSAEVRLQVNGDSDLCSWSKCSFFTSCYIRKMREAAKYAQVILVNHTLLLLDAVLGGLLLPDRDVIVVDEAHRLAEEATNAFTASVRPTRILSLLAQGRLQDHAPQALLAEITELSTHLWEKIARKPFGNANKLLFIEPIPEALLLTTRLGELAATLRERRPLDQDDQERTLYDKLISRTQNLANDMRLIFTLEQPAKYVHYYERIVTLNQRTPPFQASAAPLSVAEFLQEHLFAKTPTIIMTSATMATVGSHPTHPEQSSKPNFAYFRREVGLDYVRSPQVLEGLLPLVFNYQEQALLYTPRHLPEPAYGNGSEVERYVQAIAVEMERLVVISRGRAFLLFTSKRMLDDVYRLIAPHLPFPVLRQGDLPNTELTRRFQEVQGSILFGLKSFWEGVDIPGEALSLVIIDRLPFGVPDDPIHSARVNAMKANGEDWFGEYVLPRVVLELKQGFGRLVRTREDRGVVALLDARLQTKGYGRTVINSLPPARRSTQIRDVERFFALQLSKSR